MRFNYEITIEGKVQGVGYRYFVRARALELDLSGYARNLPDGKVAVVAEGDKKDLDTLVDYLKTGPPRARVKEVTISISPFTGNYKGFFITS